MNYAVLIKKYWWVLALIILGLSLAVYFLVRSRRKAPLAPVEVKKAINDLQQSGLQPTYVDGNYQSMAKALGNIFTGFDFLWSDDLDEAVDILLQMENDLDVMKLIQAYGSQYEVLFGLIPDGGRKTLPEAVRDDLSDSQIMTINDDYEAKGMTFKW